MPRPDVLVLGGSGFLGQALLDSMRGSGTAVGTYFAHVPSAAERRGPWLPLDVTSESAVRAAVIALEPRVVVNASVATEPSTARAVIEDGAAHAARAAFASGAVYVQISSDMVFDGESGPFAEASPPSPISPYGKAKASAERRALEMHPGTVIVRCPLMYRLAPPDPSTGAWLEGVRQGEGYALFTDEIRCPAPVEDIARCLAAVVAALAGGEALPPVLHLPGPEAISRYAFGRLVLEAHGLDPDAARAAEAGPRADRPRDLTMIAPATPRVLTAAIRSPRAALPKMRTTAATPQAASAPGPKEARAARRS